MKKLFIVLLVLTALILSSCMMPKEKNNENNNDISKNYRFEDLISKRIDELDLYEYFDNQINVGYENEEALDKIVKLLKAEDIEKAENLKIANLTLDISTKKALEVLIKNKVEGIRFAEPNFKREITPYEKVDIVDISSKAPSRYSSQWALKKLKAEEVWNLGYTGKDVIVSIMDGGSDSAHPDLQGQYVDGIDYYNKKTIPAGTSVPYGDHGTHVSGIVAGTGNFENGTGIKGLSPDAKLMVAPVFAPDFVGDFNVALNAQWSVINGAKILQNSWGGPGYSDTLKEGFDYALRNNVLVVVSTGNTHIEENWGSPNSLPGIIGVGASGPDDNVTDFSTGGDSVSVIAPGYQILSTIAHNSIELSNIYGPYSFYNGTSMASPYVSALAALLFEKYPNATGYQIRKLMELTAKDIGVTGWDEKSGYGRIDPLEALSAELPSHTGGNLEITVTDSTGKVPLAGIYVTLKRNNGPSYYARTNANGVCGFYQIDPDTYDVIMGGPDLLDTNSLAFRSAEQNSITVKDVKVDEDTKINYTMKSTFELSMAKPMASGNYTLKLLGADKVTEVYSEPLTSITTITDPGTMVFYIKVEPDSLPPLNPPTLSDNFETGDFSKMSWELSSNAPFIVDVAGVHDNVVKFADIDDDEVSNFSTTTTLPNSKYGYIMNFDYKVSSEADYDYLFVKINDEIVFKVSGNLDWETASIPLEQGENKIEFEYSKDSAASSNMDTAWIDNIEIIKLPDNYADYNVSGYIKINGERISLQQSLYNGFIIDDDPINELPFIVF
ncbi:subtilisin family serine protease [Oceanotoga teriensis]|uniref:Subtilisin family serine protease n=1 Tax=Oceanotoga teriensis TaxID=515440 RepID=A0AA45C760_9BACT|nr:S8 family serine peptidase [Oceanotoga teriensis]PWJ95131.1 subtilisin family serine protease [Oceanotoga teriensis]